MLWIRHPFLQDVTQPRKAVTDPAGLECFILEDGANRLSRNVCNYHFIPSNIPEEWRSQVCVEPYL